MFYRYYMTQRPPMPGAMPDVGLDMIEDRNPTDIIPAINRGAYAVLSYTRPLTGKELCDYELLPYDDDREREVRYKGYVVEWCPWDQLYRIYDPKRPASTIAYAESVEEARDGIDENL